VSRWQLLLIIFLLYLANVVSIGFSGGHSIKSLDEVKDAKSEIKLQKSWDCISIGMPHILTKEMQKQLLDTLQFCAQG